MTTLHPHRGQTIREGGVPLDQAHAGLVLVHGRGGTAASILPLADELAADAEVRERVAVRAPQAAGQTWYPNSFLAPLEANAPHLPSALELVDDVVEVLVAGGLAPERILLAGFSQGACLALEYAARHPRRYGGVVAFSGALIGNGEQAGRPPDDKTFGYEGSLDGTPVFVGCSDRDPHVPMRRIEQTAEALDALEADLTTRIYEGMGHTINADEVDFGRALLRDVASTATT